MKRTLFTICLVSLVLAVTISISLGAELKLVTKKGDPFVMICRGLDDGWSNSMNEGAKAAAKALGFKYQSFGTEHKPGPVIGITEDKVIQGVKLFSYQPPDPSPVPKVCEICEGNNAFFTVVWESPDWYHPTSCGDSYVSYFIPPGEGSGYKVAKILFEKLGGKGNVVYITGDPATMADVQRNAGVDQALKEFPNIKIIARQSGRWIRSEATKLMGDLVTKYGKDIDGVIAQNDSMALGVINVLEDHGHKVPVVGMNGADEAIEYIRQGRMLATDGLSPWWYGGYAVVRLFDRLNGWEPTTPERMMFFGTMGITKETIEKYHKTFVAAKKIPYDWKLMSRVLHPNDWDPQNEVWPIDPYTYWEGLKKPAGFADFPASVEKSKSSGEYDKIKKMYQEHYKRKVY